MAFRNAAKEARRPCFCVLAHEELLFFNIKLCYLTARLFTHRRVSRSVVLSKAFGPGGLTGLKGKERERNTNQSVSVLCVYDMDSFTVIK